MCPSLVTHRLPVRCSTICLVASNTVVPHSTVHDCTLRACSARFKMSRTHRSENGFGRHVDSRRTPGAAAIRRSSILQVLCKQQVASCKLRPRHLERRSSPEATRSTVRPAALRLLPFPASRQRLRTLLVLDSWRKRSSKEGETPDRLPRAGTAAQLITCMCRRGSCRCR